MSNLNQLLSMIEDEVSHGGGESLESYEREAAYEMENYLVSSEGYSRPKAKVMSSKIVKRPEIMAAINRSRGVALNGGNGAHGTTVLSGNRFTPASAAQFDFTIKRATNTIAASLPAALFAPQELENGYRQMLAPYIPAGVTLTAVNYSELDGKPNQVDFVYTEGGNTDTLTIEVVQYPYPSFLKSTITDILKLSKMRYSLSDKTKTAQFSERFNVRKASLFGTETTNKISVTANKDPRQYQDGIIDIDGEFPVDKETGIVIGVANTAVANFTVTLSIFVEKFDRQTSHGW